MDVAVNDTFAFPDTSIPQAPLLVLGLGNVLIEDEGVGIAALEYLHQHYEMPDNVELFDGGTSGMSLLDDIRGRKTLIVLDAVRTGNPPGSVVVLKDEAVPAFFRSKVSPHQMALSDVLAVLTLSDEKPENIIVIGVEPVSLKTHMGLSPTVAAQLETMVHKVIEHIEQEGYKVERLSEKKNQPFTFMPSA